MLFYELTSLTCGAANGGSLFPLTALAEAVPLNRLPLLTESYPRSPRLLRSNDIPSEVEINKSPRIPTRGKPVAVFGN